MTPQNYPQHWQFVRKCAYSGKYKCFEPTNANKQGCGRDDDNAGNNKARVEGGENPC